MFKKLITAYRRWKNPSDPRVAQEYRGFTRQQLIEALKTLRVHANHSGVPWPQLGICANAEFYLVTEHGCKGMHLAVIKTLCELFDGWELHSGNKYWPIRENYFLRPWENSNLVARIALIDYTLKKLS